jgi:hypothetical protein
MGESNPGPMHYESQAGRLDESHHACALSPSSAVVWLSPTSWVPLWLPTTINGTTSRERQGSDLPARLDLGSEAEAVGYRPTPPQFGVGQPARHGRPVKNQRLPRLMLARQRRPAET